jgi:YVTN family beta-propeller protein
MLESKFRKLPLLVRVAVAALSGVVLVAGLSLMGACGGIYSMQDFAEPDFYVAHLTGANPVWFRSGTGIPAPLIIPTLPAGTSVSDIAALRFTGPSDWLYLVSANANALLVLYRNGSTFQVTATVPVGANPFALAIDGNANFAYVSNTGGNSVTVIDLTTNTVAATIALPTGSQPRGVAVTPDGSKLYVAASATEAVIVIDTASRTVSGSIPVGSQPERMAISADGSQLYVSNAGSSTLSVIDVLSDTVSTTVTGVTGTHAAAVNGTGTDLFIGQSNGAGTGAVALYDTATVTSSTTPVPTAANPVYLLGIGPGSFLSADQAAARITEHVGTTGSATPDRVFTVGESPSSLATVREVNRAPNAAPVCHLLTSVSGNGTITTSPSVTGGNFSCGTQVTLTAVPGSDSAFVQWSGDLSGTTNPATITMDHDKNVRAAFVVVPIVQTTVEANNPFVVGLNITADGATWAGLDTYNSPVGSTHVHSTTSPQIVLGTQYTFQNWTPSLPPNSPTSLTQTVTTPAVNTAFTANFTKTGYVVSEYGCPTFILNGPAPLSQNPLVYAVNASLLVGGGPFEVFQNGAWTTYASSTTLTVSGPISIWTPCHVATPTACTAPPSGMAGWWGFDASGSTAAPDLSGNHNDATITGGTSQATGKVSGSLASGVTFASAPSSSSLNFGTGSFSADMWLRWSDLSKNQGDSWLLAKYSLGHGFDFALTRAAESPGLTRAMLRLNGSAEWDSNTPVLPADGAWHLLAFSYDATKPYNDRVTFYMDGAAVTGVPVNILDPATLKQDVTFDTTNSTPLYIGHISDPSTPVFFSGDIDEVELFNRVITTTDLQPLLAADTLGKCKSGGTVTHTIATVPTGFVVQADKGSAMAAPFQVNWVPGSSHTLSATLPQFNSTADTQYASPPTWSPAGPNIASAPATSTTYTGTFSPTSYKLTVLTSPPGCATVTLSPLPTGGFYPVGQAVGVSAGAATGYSVASITGTTNGSVTMTQPQTVTINCSQKATVAAAYSSSGSSGGTIALSFMNTGSVAVTNLQINSVASNTSTVALNTTGAGGPVSFPMKLGTLAPGQSMSRMFMFMSTSVASSVNVPFSLTVRYQGDSLDEQTATIQIPFPR